MTNLPTLTGSEKQVAWAEKIRQEIDTHCLKNIEGQMKQGLDHEEPMMREMAKEALNQCEIIRSNTDSKYWIEEMRNTSEGGYVLTQNEVFKIVVSKTKAIVNA